MSAARMQAVIWEPWQEDLAGGLQWVGVHRHRKNGQFINPLLLKECHVTDLFH